VYVDPLEPEPDDMDEPLPLVPADPLGEDALDPDPVPLELPEPEAELEPELVPDEADDDPDPMLAFVSMYAPLPEPDVELPLEAAPDVPVVALPLCPPRCRQPVTVIAPLLDVDVLLLPDVLPPDVVPLDVLPPDG